MTDRKKPPTLADLIGRTPGAQPIQKALASIKARREKLLDTDQPSQPTDFAAPEPLPVLDAPDEFAQGFFQRLVEQQSPPRGTKPRLVVDNKTPPDDDDPDPPKAA
jgi:hypothetical protein